MWVRRDLESVPEGVARARGSRVQARLSEYFAWAIALALLLGQAASAQEKPDADDSAKKVVFEVSIGDRTTPNVEPAPFSCIDTIMGEASSLVGRPFFELSPYRSASVKWVEGSNVKVRLLAEMRLAKRSKLAGPSHHEESSQASAVSPSPAGGASPAGGKREGFLTYFLADCGFLSASKDSWTFDPGDLACQGDFIDGAAVIVVYVPDETDSSRSDPMKAVCSDTGGSGATTSGVSPHGSDGRAIYFRVKNRRFPFVGTDLGIALTLTQPLSAEGDLDRGFEVNDGLSFYYAVSRLKSDRWRLITSLAALDHVRAKEGETEDPEDFEVGLGLGAMFKSNGFLDTNTGMSLAAGIGYNFMVPESSDRWYWFFGVGANFGKKGERSK